MEQKNLVHDYFIWLFEIFCYIHIFLQKWSSRNFNVETETEQRKQNTISSQRIAQCSVMIVSKHANSRKNRMFLSETAFLDLLLSKLIQNIRIIKMK